MSTSNKRPPDVSRRQGLKSLSFMSRSVQETIRWGERLGRLLKEGSVVALVGDLGSGKTSLTKGIASGLGVKNTERVRSPSFILCERYQGRIPVFHLDLFRLESLGELEEIGFEEFLYSEGVAVVEWSRKISGYLPSEFLEILLEHVGEERRRLTVHAHGQRYVEVIEKLERLR